MAIRSLPRRGISVRADIDAMPIGRAGDEMGQQNMISRDFVLKNLMKPLKKPAFIFFPIIFEKRKGGFQFIGVLLINAIQQGIELRLPIGRLSAVYFARQLHRKSALPGSPVNSQRIIFLKQID